MDSEAVRGRSVGPGQESTDRQITAIGRLDLKNGRSFEPYHGAAIEGDFDPPGSKIEPLTDCQWRTVCQVARRIDPAAIAGGQISGRICRGRNFRCDVVL